MQPVEVAAIGILVIAFAVVSMRIERWPLTMPMVFVTAGVVMDTSGLVDLTPDNEAIKLIAEVTLSVVLFSDAVRIDMKRLRRQLAIPLRLLAIGMPLTIILGTLINSWLFPDVGWVAVALVAAILAPTDAALGSAVVEDEGVPVRDRLALNVESGVNDGLAVPVVSILTAALIQENRTDRRVGRVRRPADRIRRRDRASPSAGPRSPRCAGPTHADGPTPATSSLRRSSFLSWRSSAPNGCRATRSSPRSPQGSRSARIGRRTTNPRRSSRFVSVRSRRMQRNCSASPRSSCSATCCWPRRCRRSRSRSSYVRCSP